MAFGVGFFGGEIFFIFTTLKGVESCTSTLLSSYYSARKLGNTYHSIPSEGVLGVCSTQPRYWADKETVGSYC